MRMRVMVVHNRPQMRAIALIRGATVAKASPRTLRRLKLGWIVRDLDDYPVQIGRPRTYWV